MNVYEVVVKACKDEPIFVVAEDYGIAERLFIFEFPQAIIMQMTLKGNRVVLPGKKITVTVPTEIVSETCRWIDLANETYLSPHDNSCVMTAGFLRQEPNCMTCGKKVEVV